MNYESIYNKVVSFYKNHPYTGELSHGHHIVMRSLGGIDDEVNIAHVPCRVHFFLHRCLLKFNPCKQTALAVRLMNKVLFRKLRIISSRKYEATMRETLRLLQKKVVQYDLFGNVVKIWDSGKEAQRYFGNRCCISNACSRKRTYLGFQWRFLRDDGHVEQVKPTTSYNFSNIIEYGADGKFVKLWNNFSEVINAHKEINLKGSYFGRLKHCGYIKIHRLHGHIFTIRMQLDFTKDINTIKKYNGTELTVFDRSGNIVSHFNSMCMAEKMLGIRHGSIRNIIDRDNRDSGGFRFKSGILTCNIPPYFPEHITSGKCIAQYDKNGKFVAEFSSMAKAYGSVNGDKERLRAHIEHGTLYHDCIWKIITDHNYKSPIDIPSIKAILASDTNSGNEFIFKDTVIAAKTLQTDPASISHVLNGRHKSHHGFTFKYVDIKANDHRIIAY